MRCENSASACFQIVYSHIFTKGAVYALFSKWRANTSLRPQLGILSHYCRLKVSTTFFFLHFSNFAMLFAKHRYGASVLEGVFVGLDPGISSPLSVPFVCAGPVCPCGGMCMTYHVKWRFPKTVLFPNHVIWIRVILTPILRIIASQGEIANGPECPESVANFGRNKGQHGNIGGRTGCQTSTWAFNWTQSVFAIMKHGLPEHIEWVTKKCSPLAPKCYRTLIIGGVKCKLQWRCAHAHRRECIFWRNVQVRTLSKKHMSNFMLKWRLRCEHYGKDHAE